MKGGSSPLQSGKSPAGSSGENSETAAAEFFSAEQISECRDLFSMFDTDGGGTIDRGEFGAMMKTLGLKLEERELDDFFAEMDVNQNGAIEFDELLNMLRKISRNITLEEEFEEAFRYFDLDGGGQITKVELMRVLNSMGEDIALDEAEEMIMEATSGNTEVSFETFKIFCHGAQEEHGVFTGSVTRKKAYSAMMKEVQAEARSSVGSTH